MKVAVVRLVYVLLMCVVGNVAVANNDVAVPPALQDWVPWVLEEHSQQACPFFFNDHQQRACGWLSKMTLNIDDNALHFSMRWRMYANGFVTLPGEERYWPDQVMVNGKSMPVLARGGPPQLELAEGNHQVSGVIRLDPIPDSLALPAMAGLVSLKIDGESRTHPAIDKKGRLWLNLRGDQASLGAGDSLSLRVYRKLSDGVPMRMETRLQLQVSGKAREVVIGPALLPGFAPVSLHSPLPARLEPDGRLRLQVRPGRWDIGLQARALEKMGSFAIEPGSHWPAQEIWSLEAEPSLRTWRVEGVSGVDPGQAGVPADWQQLPAYPMSVDRVLQLVEEDRRRDSADNLEVRRELWRDFAGNGYTFRDRISGVLSDDGRLEGEGLEPGRVLVNGEPAMITVHDGKQGVELRRGPLNLEVIGRVSAEDELPASGWGRDLDQLTITLHLPPGTLLWGASDVDHITNAWISRWSLWDIFLLLVLVVGSYRLAGLTTAIIAGLALLVCHDVSGAPYYSWLNLLVVLALLKVLPVGWAKRSAQIWLGISVISIVLMLLPFSVQQFRQAVYPQLEFPYASLKDDAHYQTAPVKEEAEVFIESVPASSSRIQKMEPGDMSLGRGLELKSAALDDISNDPDARIQTGPGVPDWTWRRSSLSWQGPVSAGQSFRLWQSGDGIFRLVSVLRVLLMMGWLALLLKGLAKVEWSRFKPTAASTTALLLAAFLPWQSEPAQAEMPTKELLQELEKRLTKAPECLPACADVSEVRVRADKESWQVHLRVQVAGEVMLPLPGGSGSWLPSRVLVDGVGAQALSQHEGQLRIALSEGVHDILLQGPAPVADSVALRFYPSPQRIAADANGWRTAGIVKRLLPSGTLELVREQHASNNDNRLVNPPEPAFARVVRTLRLGMDWRLETRVQRLAPARGPLSIDVGLVDGEQVLTDVPVKDGKVHVQLGADQQYLSWISRIEPTEQLVLSADDTDRFTLDWRLIADPRWHVSHDGLPPLLATTGVGTRWLPRPGDSVRLAIERPPAGEGDTLTIEAAELTWMPGLRGSNGELKLALLSSRGDNYRLQLPEGSRAESITVDGNKQPIADDRELVIPIGPGKHEAIINWRSDQGRALRTATPELDLGRDAANIRVVLKQPSDRWTLTVDGPGYGPAVLLWGVLLVILLAALGLGRVPLSPLSSVQWMLLALGISSSAMIVTVPVVLWFFAVSLRGRKWPTNSGMFNATQILLAILTFVAMLSLLSVIPTSLVLGLPDMQISGNGSSASHLVWYLDKSAGVLPSASVLSLPLWAYRGLMLLWSLWLALALMRWLPWAWRCFSQGGLWKKETKVIAGKEKG